MRNALVAEISKLSKLLIPGALALGLFLGAGPLPAEGQQSGLRSPAEHFGHEIGADRKLGVCRT
jgi:hypothetical protein